MATRDEYLARTQGYKRPAINFNKRDNFREFAGSGMGQNYHKMMDLQRQAPTFQKNDPRIDNLKQRRRQFNRYDKNNAGSIFGYTPQEMQEYHRFESNELRNRAKPVYNKMYPFTGGFMDYTEGGGLPGLLIKGAKDISGGIQQGLEKNIGDPLRAIGSDIMSNIGIGGGLDTNEEELRNYANLTYPQDVHPGLSSIEGPMEQSEVIYGPHSPTFYDRGEGLDFAEDPDQPYVAPDDYVEEDFGAFYEDEDTLVPERSMPFDDSGKEDFIRRQNEYIPPVQAELGIPNPQGDFDRFNEYPTPEIGIEFGVDNWEEPPPFNDAGREAGIASRYGQGPQYDLGGRVYEDEFRDFTSRMGDMPGGPMTYEEFVEAYKRGILPGLQGRR